jgi:hypothetical protein
MEKPVAPSKPRADAQEREAYLAGRIAYDGDRRLRYEAGWDIALATLGILKEYAADCEGPYFACVHDDDLVVVQGLIADLERINAPDNVDTNELESIAAWLHRVADILPRLWD